MGAALVAAPVAIPCFVGVLGFGSAGIIAGSWAAQFMASYGGAVTVGSICALLQSIGATGAIAFSTAIASAGGFLCAAAAALISVLWGECYRATSEYNRISLSSRRLQLARRPCPLQLSTTYIRCMGSCCLIGKSLRLKSGKGGLADTMIMHCCPDRLSFLHSRRLLESTVGGALTLRRMNRRFRPSFWRFQ